MPDNDALGRTADDARRGPVVTGAAAALGVLLVVLLALSLRRAGPALVAVVVAGFLAVGLDRPVAALVRRGRRRGSAYAMVAGAAVVAGVGAVLRLVPAFAQQVGAFLAAAPGYVDRLMATRGAADLDAHTGLAADLRRAVTARHVAELAGGLIGGVATVAGALFYGVTTAMLTLLVLWALPRLRESALRLVAASRRDRARGLADGMLDSVGGYLAGAVTVAFCAGVAAFLWCFLTGVPYPVLMAVVVAFFDLIPQIGAAIGSTVVILVAWTSSFGLAVATLVFFCAYQGIENWVIYPRMMSHAVKISNLAAIVATLLGGAVFGVLGVLLAVPVYASLQLLVRELVLPRQNAH